jgi:hypothetical protein
VSLISQFEERLERTVEGFFARLFRSGVHPVEIGKRLLRVMEDGKTVALRRTYVPNVNPIVTADPHFARPEPTPHKLAEAREITARAAAPPRPGGRAGSPRVDFSIDSGLSRGEFRIAAEGVALSDGQRASKQKAAPPPPPRSSKKAGPPSLVVMDDDGELETLMVNKRVRIGRQEDNDLVVSDPGVSRHHAEVVNRGGVCTLHDLGSTNGTFVNGSPVTEHDLRDGDQISLGSTSVEFRRD